MLVDGADVCEGGERACARELLDPRGWCCQVGFPYCEGIVKDSAGYGRAAGALMCWELESDHEDCAWERWETTEASGMSGLPGLLGRSVTEELVEGIES